MEKIKNIEEAGNCCEWCGAPNSKVIRRTGDEWMLVAEIEESPGKTVPTSRLSCARLRFHRLNRIVLTVAYLDWNKNNNENKNLAALCQRCEMKHVLSSQHIPQRKPVKDHDRKEQFKLF